RPAGSSLGWRAISTRLVRNVRRVRRILAVLGVKLLAELRPPRVRHLLRNARSLARPAASAPPRPFGVSRCRLWCSDFAGNADERGAHPPWPDVEVDAVSLTGRVTCSRVRPAVPLDGLDASIRERLDDECDV